MHACGPGDRLVVEDSEGEFAIGDEDNLEGVYLQNKH